MCRAASIFLAAAICVLTISACGSSGKAPSTSVRTEGIKFAACIRAHGVPNFPDPGSGGGIQIPTGVNPAAPAFQTAQHACRSLLPGGIGSPAPANARDKATMLALARCMRAHGVSGFPDPVSSPPQNPTGMALAFGRPGSFIVIPETLDPQSPKFVHAGKACHLPGS